MTRREAGMHDDGVDEELPETLVWRIGDGRCHLYSIGYGARGVVMGSVTMLMLLLDAGLAEGRSTTAAKLPKGTVFVTQRRKDAFLLIFSIDCGMREPS